MKALLFDAFGTVVDWRGSIAEEGKTWAEETKAWPKAKGLHIDWAQFADRWRAGYAPSMEKVRKGELPWTNLDRLHRALLEDLLTEFHIEGLTDDEKDHWNRVWHRLKPWPDSVPGLTRLRTKYTIAPLSNGNIILMIDMAKRARLPWDAILGAEIVQTYKPNPEAYLRTADILALKPEQICMAAAHNSDLAAARACGLRTAFIPRLTEHGPNQTTDLIPEEDWDIIAPDLNALATSLQA